MSAATIIDARHALPASREGAEALWKLAGLVIVVAFPTLFWTLALLVVAHAAAVSISNAALLTFATAVAVWCLLVARAIMAPRDVIEQDRFGLKHPAPMET